MRTAVEFLELYCAKTKGQSEDEVSLKFNQAVIWSGPMRNGITRKIETIKATPELTGTVELWHEDPPRRNLNKLGTHAIQPSVDPGALRIKFTEEGADYTLAYKLLQIPD